MSSLLLCQDYVKLDFIWSRRGRDFKAAHNFTSGADIARYMSNRIKLVQDLISFFVKLNMAETSITFSSRMSYLGVYLTRTPP